MEIIEVKDPFGRFTDAQWQEMIGLFSNHWDELTTAKDLMQLKPKIDHYKAAQDEGTLHVLILTDGDKIAGYSISFCYYHLHWSDTLIFHNDIIYINPEYRKGSWGLRLIKKTEEAARERGAKLMFWHGKVGSPFADLMVKTGHWIQDVVFAKRI